MDEISHYHRRVLEKHYGFPKFKYHVMKTTIFIGLILITSTVGSSLKESANNLPLVGGTVSGGINTGPIIQNSITKTKCLLSEYECTNGKCISIDKYCDKRDDCGDNSDEPRFCSRCNFTYYGNVGRTYSLDLHRPNEENIPYVCLLNITAAGGIYGDIVQVIFQSFTLGRFVSYTQDGCPDGYLQISEAARPPVGGRWCGSSWGPVIFYSETRTLILAVHLLKLAKNQSGYNFDFRLQYKVLSRDSSVVRHGGQRYEEIKPWYNYTGRPYNEDYKNTSSLSEHLNFEQHLTDRKILPGSRIRQKDGRFIEPKYDIGKLILGTYCSRIYSDCDKNLCRLQSPNFPGVYPRNLTCYFAIKQHDIPPGKHAVITVKQPKGNLIWIQTDELTRSQKEKEKILPKINTWNDCDSVQDYITIYDGYTTRDPILLKFCGGGQGIPESTSSGPELLVEFTTSPYGTFNSNSANGHNLNGFQLEIEVKFVDVKSDVYVKNKRHCEFWIIGNGHGVLENPINSLAPNSSCLYHLQGSEAYFRQIDQLQLPRRAGGLAAHPAKFKVWISMMKFNLAPKFPAMIESTAHLPIEKDCSGMMRIWDGNLRDAPDCSDLNCSNGGKTFISRYGLNSSSLIVGYCHGLIPRSCDHANLNKSNSRPCTLMESYVSTSDHVTIELRNTESTALRPLNFKLRYEFVDLGEDGAPIEGHNECNRQFISSLMDKRASNVFRSTRNVFSFGRGGQKDLKCTYRFEANRDELVKIVIKKISTGRNRTCVSKLDKDVNRSFCYENTDIKLEMFERLSTNSILFHRGCVCNGTNSSNLPVSYVSSTRDLEIHFSAFNMTAEDDHTTIYFEGTFEFIRDTSTCKESRKKFGTSGATNLAYEDVECRSKPWLIEPSVDKYLYVRLDGILLRYHNPNHTNHLNTSFSRRNPLNTCETNSRIILTTGNGITAISCPLSPSTRQTDYVEVFSDGWHQRDEFNYNIDPSRLISVEYIRPDDGDYTFTWLEMSPKPLLGLIGMEQCAYRCPGLDACVNQSIFCDGNVHCPSGYDESFAYCSPLLQLPIEILATIFITLFVLSFACFTFIYRKLRKCCRGSSVLQTRLKSMSSSMDTETFDDKEVIS